MSKPLEGVRIIEIAQEIQGPFAGLFLADLGAEVTKVENREIGDLSRWLLAQLIGGPNVKNANVSHYFTAMNRGKRSITADLKKPEAIAIVRRMVKTHDVLMTNYRPGVLERLGLGYEELLTVNPRIIFAQASSWGPQGPWAKRPSRDTLAQAASGLMSKTGMPDDNPLPAGAAIADQAGALTLAGGILAALFARERTGQGQRIDASIYGTMIAAQGFELNYASMTGEEPQRAGRCHPFLHGIWGAFRTSDGHLCIAGVDDQRWPRFCRIMGIEELLNDSECDNVTRNFHGAKIEKVLDGIFPRKSTAEWLKELTDADILVTEVANYQQVLASEQARINGYLLDLEHPVAGKITVTGCPVTLNGEVTHEAQPAPEHGQHTEEILLELGYSWEEIGALRDAQVV
ncbi:MAG TPA: CaiB/BaiF CoA-transferase family protein [Candidatus Binataceae bacterium]|nr:CaiB/BaiF CoA-transferase family protein [Candidatus Binataceae bacterium]